MGQIEHVFEQRETIDKLRIEIRGMEERIALLENRLIHKHGELLFVEKSRDQEPLDGPICPLCQEVTCDPGCPNEGRPR